MMIIDNDKEPAFFTKISGVVRSKLLEEVGIWFSSAIMQSYRIYPLKERDLVLSHGRKDCLEH